MSVVKFCPLNRTWILSTFTHRSYDFLNQTYTSVPIIGLNELGRDGGGDENDAVI